MSKLVRNEKTIGGSASTASGVGYDASSSTVVKKSTVQGAISDIDTKVGGDTLTTTAQTCSGAVNELDATLGHNTLETTAQTVTGGINELKENLALKQKIATSTTSIVQVSNTTATSTSWSFSSDAVGISFLMYYAGNLYDGVSSEVIRKSSLTDETVVVNGGDSSDKSKIAVSINWTANTITLKANSLLNQYWVCNINAII